MKKKILFSLFAFITSFLFVNCSGSKYSLVSSTLEIKSISAINEVNIQLAVKDKEAKLTFPSSLEEVKIDNNIVDNTKYKYDGITGLLIFSKDYINSKISIKAEAKKYYDVNIYSSTLAISRDKALEDEEYNATLSIKNPTFSKSLPDKLSEVSVGDKKLNENEYKYNNSTGNILISKDLINADIKIVAEEYDKRNYSYIASFDTDSHCKIFIYDTQDYSVEPVKGNIAYSRDGETGKLLKDGSGQINFKVQIDEGYDIDFIFAKGLYKDLKNSKDTKKDDVYRITKIRNDLSIKVRTKKVNIKDIKYHLEDESKFIFSWDIRNNSIIDNIEIKVEHEKFNEPIIENITENSYTYIDSDVSFDKPYYFTFTPIYKDGTRGAETKLNKMINKADKTSNFPRIEIKTENDMEPTFHRVSEEKYASQSEYVKSNIKIFNNNELKYQSSESGFKGSKIKIRGNYSSIYYTKKPYKIKLTDSADLLQWFYDTNDGINYKNKEWVLLDANLTRAAESDLNSEIFKTPIGFKLAELMNFEWKPRYKIVQVYMNDDYKGLYVLSECTTIGEGEGDTQSRYKIDSDGYIIEKDVYFDYENISFKTLIIGEEEMSYSFKYPNEDDFNESSQTYLYIQKEINNFEYKLKWFSSYEELIKIIDMTSFARWLLAHDILSNNDGRGSNAFLYKKNRQNESKIKMGTIWDLDATLQKPKNYSIQRSCPELYFQYLRYYSSFNNLVRSEFNKIKDTIVNDISNYLNSSEFDNNTYNNLLSIESKKYGFKNIVTIEKQKEKIIDYFNTQISWLDNKL